MNLLKRLWNGLVKKTATDEIEEPPAEIQEETVAEIFRKLCEEAGIAKRWVDRYKMTSAFTDWYDGPADVESIRSCIAQFKKETPSLASKLVKLN